MVIFSLLRSSYEYAEDKVGKLRHSKFEDEHTSEALKIQATVLHFLEYLFNNSAEFQDACRNRGDLMEDLVSIIFQHPQDPAELASNSEALASGKVGEI